METACTAAVAGTSVRMTEGWNACFRRGHQFRNESEQVLIQLFNQYFSYILCNSETHEAQSNGRSAYAIIT